VTYTCAVRSHEILFTIGYQGRTLPDFVRSLIDADVEQVIDVRELPLSRRRGFSKTPLRTALEESGIEYVHIRAAGNPYRHDAPKGLDRCLAMYRAHLERHPEVTASVLRAAAGKRSALLCAEANADQCHRSVLAASAAKQARRFAIQNL